MHREKAAMDFEHRGSYGNARDPDSRKSGWESTTELPAWKYYVQIWQMRLRTIPGEPSPVEGAL
jgi:hypothetical protein